ncbi:ion channel [Paracoccus jiaweipingae]|uniref:ion channel n=1 Tax=unclassified Paracoccus (in: a-proteobacteria) TaxID=2688777 RepID=UPI0037925080
MFGQIALGSVVMLSTVLIAGISVAVMETLLNRFRPWLKRHPHKPKQIVVLMVSAFWVLGLMTISVWIWAFVFVGLGVFPDLEHATYFSLVCFTTLGFGDVLLPEGWRLLGGLAAANGLLNIGLMTALLVETLRDIRNLQGGRG